MPRHSKNSTNRGFHTYHEKQKLGYGTTRIRLGQDSQLSFGTCCLTLKHGCKDPVATPSGHVYSKKALCSYMLDKIREIKEWKVDYDKQQRDLKKNGKEEEEEEEIVEKKKKTFLAIRDGKPPGVFDESNGSASKSNEKNRRKRTLDEMRCKMDTESKEKKRQDLKRTSYWLPESAPEAIRKKIQKPPKRPPSPMTGRPLRMKHLVPITFTTDPDDSNIIICPVSKKKITNQRAVLIKPTGYVILRSVFERLREKSEEKTTVCPVTGETLNEDDVMDLVRAGSSFASTGNVMATKWAPAI